MKNTLRVILTIFLLLGTSAFAASPTLYGPTGLVTMPTAEGLRYKEFDLGLNYIPPYLKGEENDHGDIVGQDESAILNYYANLGAFEGLEVGFSGRGGREGVFVNMKYYLISDTSENPLSMAIGMQNLSSYYDTGLYMVMSKQVNLNLGLNFGFLGRFYSGTSDTNMMFGLKYMMSEQWAMMLDTVGEHNIYSWNLGMQMQLGETMALNMSALNILNPVERKNSVFAIGLNWTGFM